MLDDPMERIRVLSSPEAIPVVNPEFIVGLVEALPDALIVVNADGIIVLTNAQCEFLFGYHRSAMLGQAIDMLLPSDLRAVHTEHLKHFFETPRARPMGSGQALIGRHKNGGDIHVEINLSPVVTADGVYGVAIIRKRESATGAVPHGARG